MTEPDKWRPEPLGPNHKDGCDGRYWRYSGDGYNRVRVCNCGAEDFAPTATALRDVFRACGIPESRPLASPDRGTEEHGA